MISARDEKILEKHIAQMMEHFDTVQVFVTRHENTSSGGGTLYAAHGAGNQFARLGQIKEYITRQDEITRDSVRM